MGIRSLPVTSLLGMWLGAHSPVLTASCVFSSYPHSGSGLHLTGRGCVSFVGVLGFPSTQEGFLAFERLPQPFPVLHGVRAPGLEFAEAVPGGALCFPSVHQVLTKAS